MPQEPASATSAADQAAAGGSVPWRSADAFERAEARRATANVRRWGVGSPDLRECPDS